MSWLGMLFSLLPGEPGAPGDEHPGAGNIQRELEKKQKEQADSQGTTAKPDDEPDTPPQTPEHLKENS